MITNQQITDLLADTTKEVLGDIHWESDPTHPGARKFSAAVRTTPDRGLTAHGWWRPDTGALFYSLRHPEVGRLVGLCLGPGIVHHGPMCKGTRASKRRCDCPRGMHMHRWTEEFGDRWVYVPESVTADSGDPAAAWRQFCATINLAHRGTLYVAERGARW